jgi:hypothetical protein
MMNLTPKLPGLVMLPDRWVSDDDTDMPVVPE